MTKDTMTAEVTQADREAAVRIMADRWNTVHKAKVLTCKADHWVPVQECARHRIEATRKAEAERDEAYEALEKCVEALSNHACHVGADAPCRRSKVECDTDCGFDAGNALLSGQTILAKRGQP